MGYVDDIASGGFSLNKGDNMYQSTARTALNVQCNISHTKKHVSLLRLVKGRGYAFFMRKILTMPWGTTRDDFETTFISLREDRNVYGVKIFEKVSFGPITADISRTTERSISKHLKISGKPMEDIKTKLLPLKQTINPLARMRILPQNMNGTWGTSGENKNMPTGLCRLLLNAFMHDMDDNNGKIALRELLACVVRSLNLDDTLLVAQTGGSSPSQFATCMSKQVTVYASSESSSESQSPGKSPNKQAEGSMDSPSRLDVPAASSNSISPTIQPAERSPSFSKSKLCTADVLVYSTPNGVDKPIRAHLVVSLKKGKQKKLEVDIIEALLSRLPYQYQFGAIYGVLINSSFARFYSVEYDNEDDHLVSIVKYAKFSFECTNDKKKFDIEEFLDFILSIALILKSQSPGTC